MLQDYFFNNLQNNSISQFVNFQDKGRINIAFFIIRNSQSHGRIDIVYHMNILSYCFSKYIVSIFDLRFTMISYMPLFGTAGDEWKFA
jgi:hypothetical protein